MMGEYERRFDTMFPLMCCMDMTDAEIIERIGECLESGTPFEPEDGVDY